MVLFPTKGLVALLLLMTPRSTAAASAHPSKDLEQKEKQMEGSESTFEKPIHGLKFALTTATNRNKGDKNKRMEWKAKIGSVGLANLGVDLRSHEQRFPKRRAPFARELFPKSLKVAVSGMRKKEVEAKTEATQVAFQNRLLLGVDQLFKGGGGGNGDTTSSPSASPSSKPLASPSSSPSASPSTSPSSSPLSPPSSKPSTSPSFSPSASPSSSPSSSPTTADKEPLTCLEHEMNKTSPCGQCQQSNEFDIRYIYRGRYGACLDVVQCADILTGDCSDATSACFVTNCGGYNNTIYSSAFSYFNSDVACVIDYGWGNCDNPDYCVSIPNNESDGQPCGEPNVVDGVLTCQDVAVTSREPCGYCQTANPLYQYLYVDSSFAYCLAVAQCVNKTGSGYCGQGEATDQCFRVDECPRPDYSQYFRDSFLPTLQGLCLLGFTYGTCNGETDYCAQLTSNSNVEECPVGGRQLDEATVDLVSEIPNKSDGLYVGFVRIPKTGSSTLLKFLQKTRQLFQWNLFVSEGTNGNKNSPEETRGATSGASRGSHQNDKSNVPSQRRRRQQDGPAEAAGACVFGVARSKSEISPSHQAWWNSCAHVSFGQLVASWAQSLSLWTPPELVENKPPEEDASYEKTLHVFTMVRDPFDRLVSYFYYLRKFSYTNNFLMNTVTKTQYKFVEGNDLEGWLRQMHIENGGRGLNLPYQYKYVHEDVNEAIKLIQNGANPQVYTLLTECYEVSLRLMAENFVGFRQGEVDKFIESEDYETNNNKALYSEKPNKTSLEAIRAKAKVWFADDFKFYDVAVDQFIEKIRMSSLSLETFKTCPFWKEDSQELVVALDEAEA